MKCDPFVLSPFQCPIDEAEDKPKPRLYVALWYERHPDHDFFPEEDWAFKRAAHTFIEDVKNGHYVGYHFNRTFQPGDQIYFGKFHTSMDIKNHWDIIKSYSPSSPIYAMGIFSHHTSDANKNSGYITGWHNNIPRSQWNFSAQDAYDLDQLQWDEDGFIFLANCNGDTGNDNIAANLASKQSVTVYATKAYASFSENYMNHRRISNKSTKIYLLSFVVPRNLPDVDAYLPSGRFYDHDETPASGLARRINEVIHKTQVTAR